jgi:hypothetical protein
LNRRRLANRIGGTSLAASLFLLAAGCGGGEDRVPVFPAKGKVLVDGQPAGGVQLRFYPEGAAADLDALKPAAVSGEDGSFRLGTYETSDGAPAGRYKVTLYLPKEPPNGANSPDDLLGGQYIDPGRTTLEATISEGENELRPFEVKKAPEAGRPSPPRATRPDSDGVG